MINIRCGLNYWLWKTALASKFRKGKNDGNLLKVFSEVTNPLKVMVISSIMKVLEEMKRALAVFNYCM